MNTERRLSVPTVRRSTPRPVTDDEGAVLVELADLLCGPTDKVPPPSELVEYPQWLDVALTARNDSFDTLVALAADARQAPDKMAWLRQLHVSRPDDFQVLSAVLCGAYLMVPSIKRVVGYPGQHRDVPGITEAVDEIMDGILDPVLERGHFFVPTPKA